MSDKMAKAINDQINAEMYSAYLYLSMEAYFKDIGMDGAANWMEVQAQEEMSHAMKFYYFLNERGARVLLGAIEAPETEWKSPLDVFENVYAHEQKVTGLINDLVTLAHEEKDYATASFLNWYVDEQVEEEANADEIKSKMKLAEGAQGALFMIDKELGMRVFVNSAFGPNAG